MDVFQIAVIELNEIAIDPCVCVCSKVAVFHQSMFD